MKTIQRMRYNFKNGLFWLILFTLLALLPLGIARIGNVPEFRTFWIELGVALDPGFSLSGADVEKNSHISTYGGLYVSSDSHATGTPLAEPGKALQNYGSERRAGRELVSDPGA